MIKMKKKKIELSIIIPAYNEEDCIEKTILDVFKVFRDAKINFELILVDDGSTDNTLRACKALQKKLSFSVIHLNKNQGYSKALKTGFLKAMGEYITYMDADLQHPPDQILKLYRAAVDQAYDFVTGCCNKKNYRGKIYPYFRRLASKSYNLIVRILFKTKTGDAHAKKVFKRKLIHARKIYALYGLMDLELLLIGLRESPDIKAIPLKVNPRFAGKSKLTPWLMLRTLINVFRLKWFIRKENKIENAKKA